MQIAYIDVGSASWIWREWCFNHSMTKAGKQIGTTQRQHWRLFFRILPFAAEVRRFSQYQLERDKESFRKPIRRR